MPSHSTVISRWLNESPEFVNQYARARSTQADYYAEQIVDIADESPALIFRDVSDDGESKTVISVDSAAVNHQRLRVDARKWFASKVAPKKYGDKTEIEHSGNVSVNVVNYGRDNLTV